MKRKGSPVDDEREVKRSKPDSEQTAEELSVDVVREILKHLDDVEFIRLARVSTIWNKASLRERNRFIEQRITLLRSMHGLTTATTNPQKLLDQVQDNITQLKSELDRQNQLWFDLHTGSKHIQSVIERFHEWQKSPTPKRDYKNIKSVQPEGEIDIWAMQPFVNYDGSCNGRIVTLDHVLEVLENYCDATVYDLEQTDPAAFERAKKIIRGEITEQKDIGSNEKNNEDVNNNNDNGHESEEELDMTLCKGLFRLEKYLEVLMDLNFGSSIYIKPIPGAVWTGIKD